jgi:hypothetical protein
MLRKVQSDHFGVDLMHSIVQLGVITWETLNLFLDTKHVVLKFFNSCSVRLTFFYDVVNFFVV